MMMRFQLDFTAQGCDGFPEDNIVADAIAQELFTALESSDSILYLALGRPESIEGGITPITMTEIQH